MLSPIGAKITFGKNILGNYDKKRLRRDSLWVANNHSTAIIGILSAPIALLFIVIVSLFLGHKIMVCYIVLILFNEYPQSSKLAKFIQPGQSLV